MTERDDKTQKSGRRIAAVALGGSVLMLALSFASVPLYRAFCAATGFGGTPQRVREAATTVGQRVLTVRFDANVAHDLPWRFEPEVASISLRTGETATIYYKVLNLADHETRGTAAYNISPEQAASYFNKLACFCFQEQRLAAHESAEWPVVFFLDPALEKDEGMANVEEVTLSYSFFAPKGTARTSEASPGKPRI